MVNKRKSLFLFDLFFVPNILKIITCGAAYILWSVANILRSKASILKSVHEILSVLGFSKGKILSKSTKKLA